MRSGPKGNVPLSDLPFAPDPADIVVDSVPSVAAGKSAPKSVPTTARPAKAGPKPVKAKSVRSPSSVTPTYAPVEVNSVWAEDVDLNTKLDKAEQAVESGKKKPGRPRKDSSKSGREQMRTTLDDNSSMPDPPTNFTLPTMEQMEAQYGPKLRRRVR